MGDGGDVVVLSLSEGAAAKAESSWACLENGAVSFISFVVFAGLEVFLRFVVVPMLVVQEISYWLLVIVLLFDCVNENETTAETQSDLAVCVFSFFS